MKYLFVLKCILLVSIIQAQDSYKRPVSLDNPREGYRLSLRDIGNQGQDTWNVFVSDGQLRSQNPFGQLSNLSFMHKLQVIGHRSQNNSIQLHVYSKAEGKDYGWIDTKHLLLSEFGQIDRKTGFRLKYLPVARVGEIDTRFLEDSAYSVRFYTAPSIEYPVNFTVKAFSGFWYMYKKKGDWCLLGRSSKLNNGPVIDKQLIGWIQEDKLLQWDQRLVLQPNQDTSAVAERLRAGLVITAFYDSLEAQDYAINPGSSINFENNVFSPELQDSYNREELTAKTIRWPILSDSTASTNSGLSVNNDVYRVGVKGRPSSNAKKVDFNQVELDALAELLNESEQSFNEINVVFVIDATFSMGDYIASVRDAMLQLIDVLQSDKRSNYSFGAVLYTDAIEGPEGLRTSGTMMDFQKMASWLSDKNEYYTEQNITLKEGVFEGLLEGVKFFDKTIETNFIIHVGDAAGRDNTTNNKKKLLEELHKYDVSLISIQAHNPLSKRTGRPLKSYQDFHLQMKDLILEVVELQDSDLRQSTPENIYKSFFASQGQGRKLSYIDDTVSNAEYSSYETALNRYPIQSKIQISHPGYEIPWQTMTTFIRNSMLVIEQNNNQLLNEMYTSKGEGLGEKTFKASIVDRLRKAGFSLADINLWLGRAYEALLEVYVPRKIEGAQYPLLEFALFIDQEELKDLRNNLQKLVDSRQSPSKLKDPDNPRGLYQTIIRILKLYIDESDEEAFADIQISTALRLMIGLNSEYDSGLNGYLAFGENNTLNKIRHLDDNEVRLLVNGIEKIWDQLSPTLWEDNAFISYGGQKYYWIPQRALVIERL